MDTTNERRKQLIDTYKSRKGFKTRVIAKCIECIYDPTQQGTWRRQVEKCSAPSCALYDVRPIANYTEKSGELKVDDDKSRCR